jgi:HEAT repeat protein
LLLPPSANENNAINLTLQSVAALTGIAGFGFAVLGKSAQGGGGTAKDAGGGWSPVGAQVLRVQSRERSQEDSFKAYLRQMDRLLADLGLNKSPFVPLTMVKGPAPVKTEVPDFLPDLEWMSKRVDAQYVNAEPERIDLLDIPDRFDQTVLLGEPGAGKTTCLQRLALDVLEQAAAWQEGRDDISAALAREHPPLPLYASLSQWRQGVEASDFLQGQLRNLLGPENYYAVHFEDLLAHGHFILLLDGLNELPGRRRSPNEGRHEQREEPGHAASRMPEMSAASIDRREIQLRELAGMIGLQSKFILTCRSHEYFDSRRWQTVRILPMSPEQTGRFIDSYLPHASAAELRASLNEESKLATIANNPFFLRAIITIYRPGLKLTNRGQILAYLYKNLLLRERERGTEMPPEPVVTGAVGRAAYDMLATGKIGNNAEVDVPDETGRASLRVLAGTGLVTEHDGTFYFLHQIIQEFFAAMALHAGTVRRGPRTLLADKRWSEVVGLWCDLDRDRMPDRVTAALQARNLPWRRPRSSVPPLLIVYRMLADLVVLLVAASFCWRWVLGPARVLGFPVNGLGLLPLGPVLVALAVGLLWSCLVRHNKIEINCTYVLSQARYAQALHDIISSMSGLYHAEAAEVAGYIGGAFGVDALPPVTRGLGHRKWRVRVGCVLILGEIARSCPDDKRAVEYLLAVADAGDPQLMRALVEALRGCRDNRIPSAMGQLLSNSRTSPMTLQFRLQPLSTWGSDSDAAWSDDAIARFDELAKTGRAPLIRSAAFMAMGVLRIPDCEARLGSVATDPAEEKDVRQGAVKGLGLIQTPLAVERLVEVAERWSDLRSQACKALQQIRHPATIPALAAAALSPRWEVRQAAAVALGSTGRPETFPALEQLASDADEDVREAAARALSLIDLPAAVPVLGQLARDRVKPVRRAALEALSSRYPNLASPEMLALAEDNGYPDRVRVIRAVGRHAHPGIEARLTGLLANQDKDVREAAAEALRAHRVSVGRQRRGSGGASQLRGARGRLAGWLQLDSFVQLMKEERMAGIPEERVFMSVYTRVVTDAELTRRFRPLIRLYVILVNAFLILGVFIIALILRFTLWAATGMLSQWPYFTGLLGISALTVAFELWGFSDVGPVRLLRKIALAVLVISVIGGLFYVWWIVTPSLVVAVLTLSLINMRRRRMRRRDVRAAIRLAHAALTPAI